jgi:GntR family transcriptional regulator/MocR family aminotransferase
MAYGDPMGHMPFREAIAEYLGAARAVRCDASQIMVVSGSQHGLQVTARALLDDGDAVWMEEPGYPGAHRALAMAGVKLVAVPTDQEGLDVDGGIRRAGRARAAYITPSHQYPMGMTMSAARRMKLLNWAQKARAWIIEDDYDSEYRFGGHPLASVQGLGRGDRVIYVGTFSKVLFPALRVGYLVIPKELVPGFRVARDSIDLFPSTLFQRALTDFIRQGHFARHIRRMRILYMERRRMLIEALNENLGDRIEIVSADAGMHLVCLLPLESDDRDVSRQAAPGRHFRHSAFNLLSGTAFKARFGLGLWRRGRQGDRNRSPQAGTDSERRTAYARESRRQGRRRTIRAMITAEITT